MFHCLHPSIIYPILLPSQAGTVKKWVDRWQNVGNVDTLPRSGRPRVLDDDIDAAIVQRVQQSGFITAVGLKRDLQLQCSAQPVRRTLHNAGYHARKPSKKPGMTQAHKDRRLEFAQQHLEWDQQWNQTDFVDEKIFSTAANGTVTLWRPRGTRYNEENLLLDHRQGRITVSFWGSMTIRGPGDLVLVNERMIAEGYRDLLDQVMLPHAQELFPEGMINFVHDNSGPHRGLIVQDWIAGQDRLHCLPWPALSPDLNPIENVWARIAQRWNGMANRRDREDLIDCVLAHWLDLHNEPEFFHNLVRSMPRRLAAVIASNGAPTRY